MTMPSERELHAAWNQFLITLGRVVQLGQLLEPEHRDLVGLLDRACGQLAGIVEQCGSLVFQQHEESIFVNAQRLRCDGPTFIRHMQFLQLLRARRIGGVRFGQALTRPQWNEFVLAISRYNRESRTTFQDCARQIQLRGLAEAVELTPADDATRVRQATSVRLDRRTFATRTYAKAMALLREYIRHLDDAAQRSYYHLKLSRAVQDLVTVCLEDGWKYLGIVHNKHYDSYLHNHSVNVAILSLILGVQTGLRRAHLHELGMAALLHDLGKAFLSPELLRKAGRFTPEERRQLLQHPMLGVQALLRVKQYNEALLKRIMVLCEHHEAIQGANHHLYSRIIAVAETFDALTSDRPHRAAFLPDSAVKMLIEMAGKRLDADLVRLFVRTLGLFPCGTCVELSTGELAIVFHPSPDPKMWMSPIVRIIRDKDGIPYRMPRQVDLAAVPKGATEPPRYIARTVDPTPLGINVAGQLHAEAATT
ncbi:MAG: HD domain-containing protein [Planctomycetes bacterium]|nr:HD domain-containing protein [Planctomycetota bacterium]